MESEIGLFAVDPEDFGVGRKLRKNGRYTTADFALRGMPNILARCDVLMVEFSPNHLRDVAGVNVSQFLAVIAPHFTRMTIPSDRVTVRAAEFEEHLLRMYQQDKSDSGLIFEKA